MWCNIADKFDSIDLVANKMNTIPVCLRKFVMGISIKGTVNKMAK